jgi:hypothetical protein
MNKILLPLFLSLFSLGFLSCIDESAPTTAAATVDTVSAGEIFDGYTLDLNPTILFHTDGTKGTYNNSASDSGFPSGTSIEVDITYVDGGVGLEITFAAADPSVFGTDALSVTVQDFKDDGNDGYIDAFTVTEAKVGSTPIAGFVAVTKTPNHGEMKRSEADLDENSVAVEEVDTSGAPTVEEWNKYIVGSAFLAKGSDGDLSLVSFETATTGTVYGLSGEDKGDKETFTYTYGYDSQTEGVIDYKGAPYAADDDYPNYPGAIIQWTADLDLVFTDWYNGTYAESQGKDTIVETDEVIWEDTSPGSGTFSVVKNVSVYVD